MSVAGATETELATVPAEVARAAAVLAGEAFFGLSGSGNFHLTHELRDAGLSYYAVTHEAACVAAADGYARASGRVGVATVHQGPGLTNAMTALRETVRSHSPVVLFAADVPHGNTRHNQYADQRALVLSTGAAVEIIDDPASAYSRVVHAFRRAELEQRPVVVLLPIDVQGKSVTLDQFGVVDVPLPRPPSPHPSSIREALTAIGEARRPLILAGRGAVRSGAGDAIARLVEHLGAPVLTSTQAHGLFSDSPYSLGIAGGFGSPKARKTLRSADLVLVFGCSLNPWTLAENHDLAEHARIVRVDTCAEAFISEPRVSIGIQADCALTAQALIRELSYRSRPETAWQVREVAPTQDRQAGPSRGTVHPEDLTRALDSLLPEQRTISIDSGHFMIFPASTLRPPDPQGFILAQGFMSMGLALAEGVGACVARPDRPAIVTVGDGGAKMSICEIDTAVRYSLPLLVVIYNDAAFGAEVHDFAEVGRPLDTVQFADVDFLSVAQGFGAAGCTVRNVDDLVPLQQWLSDLSGPFVIDAKVDPSAVGDWVD